MPCRSRPSTGLLEPLTIRSSDSNHSSPHLARRRLQDGNLTMPINQSAEPGTAPRHHRVHIIPSGPNAGISSRAVVRSSCRTWGVTRDIEDVAIHCASELAINTHLHVDYSKFMGRTSRLYVWIESRHLIVDVRDPDPYVPPFDMASDLEADELFMPGYASERESGRGLHIVRALVRECDGFYHGERLEDGKSMYIGLPLDNLPALGRWPPAARLGTAHAFALARSHQTDRKPRAQRESDPLLREQSHTPAAADPRLHPRHPRDTSRSH